MGSRVDEIIHLSTNFLRSGYIKVFSTADLKVAKDYMERHGDDPDRIQAIRKEVEIRERPKEYTDSEWQALCDSWTQTTKEVRRLLLRRRTG